MLQKKNLVNLDSGVNIQTLYYKEGLLVGMMHVCNCDGNQLAAGHHKK